MVKIKYITVDTSKLEGIVKAEKFLEKGWKIGSVGFSTIQLYRKEDTI